MMTNILAVKGGGGVGESYGPNPCRVKNYILEAFAKQM